MVRAPAAQAGGPGFDPQWLPRIFFLSAGLLIMVDGMKDLVQFGCYQHRCEWGEGSVII